MEEKIRESRFLIAEILACVSFILNTISVISVTGGGPIGPTPKFGLIYQIKTLTAIFGIFYFFYSGVFSLKQVSWRKKILTILILLYSIPIINILLNLPLIVLFKKMFNTVFDYREMIISQIIWCIPVLIIAIDIAKRLKDSDK